MSRMRLEGKIGEVELNIKRCYLPGVVLKGGCPVCGKPYTRDLGRDYLSHPVANTTNDIYCYCDGEDGSPLRSLFSLLTGG